MLVPLRVDPGSSARLPVRVATSPVQSGAAGAIVIASALLVEHDGSTLHDLTDDLDLSGFKMYEGAAPLASQVEATVDDVPDYTSGGTNRYECHVATLGSVAVGMKVRVKGKARAAVYRVVALGSSSFFVHAREDGFDIEDGDVIEAVDATGVYYSDDIVIPVDDYMDSSKQYSSVRLVLRMSQEGANPGFSTQSVVSVDFALTLDVGQQRFSVG